MKKSLLFFASCFCVALLFGQTNLAFNKITTASGYATSWGHKNEFAVDGKFDTRWQASQAEGALISTGKYTQDYWIYVDLTQNYSIGAVRIFWEAAFANDYNIDVSLDGNVWETIKEIRNSDGDIDLSYLASQTGRYLRIHTLVGNMVWAPSIFELQVFAANDVPAPDNFSENFEKGLPTNLSFAETNGSFYSQQISTTLTNSSLVITAASGVSATSSYKLNFDLSTTHNLDLATFPKISFDYQASKNATLQITATTQLGASIDLGTFPLYGSAYLLSANLAVTATDLAQVSKLEFKITTADAQTISLDNFQMGRYATNFSFAILAPSVSAKVLEGADVLFATNAQVGKVVFYRNSQKVGEASAWPYQYKLTGLTRGLQNLKAEYYDTEGKLVSTLERSFVCEPT
ncbi:MAG: hypothetical protein RIS47_543, partial [Bacteroidota bacterium]